MSKRPSVVVILVIAVGLVYWWSTHNAMESSGPLNLKAKKLMSGTSKHLGLKHTTKLRGPLSARISVTRDLPVRAGEVFTVIGELISDEDLESVSVKWDIPNGVEVVSGSSEFVLSHLPAGQPQTFELVLRPRTEENHQIHLITSAAKNGIAFADSTQFNSADQMKINSDQLVLEKNVVLEAEQNMKKSKYKVLH